MLTAPRQFISKADHTGFTVRSVEESLKFWSEVLGFKHLYTKFYPSSDFLSNVVGVDSASVTLAMVEVPGGHLIELLEYHTPDDRQVFKPRSCDIGSVHLAFNVSDIEALLIKIEEAGWRRLGEIQTVADEDRLGLRIAYARGPDGETLEFLQWPEEA